jgi:hypothetical protein
VSHADIKQFVDTYVTGKNYVLGIASSDENLKKLNLSKAAMLK